MAQAVHLRKYGVQTTINFDLFEIDGVDFRVNAAHASGDTKVMKDEGAEANTSNGFTDEGQGYSLVLDATEMQAARLVLYVVDQSTKVWLDKSVVIETYGNASAMHAFDLDTAVQDVNIASTDDIDLSATQKASVNTEVDTALVDIKLDHLIAVADGDDVANNSIIAHLAATTGDWSTFDDATDSLQAQRDNLGSKVGASISADIAAIEAQTDDIGTAGAGLSAVPWNAAWDAEVQSEVADALAVFWTTPATLVDLIWDEVLNKAGHNVAQSAGKRIRQIDAAFEVHSGTAQAGGAATITLDTGASTTNSIYNGDRIIIVDGTGVQEHGIVVSYVGSTRVATMAENWTIQPDNTSEFEVVPADVDVETWQHNPSTASGGGLPDVNVNEVGDTSQTAGDIIAIINALNDISTANVASEMSDAISVDTLTEAYASDGAAGTLAQLLYEILQSNTEFAISGTTVSVKGRDGSTEKMTFTLDDATSPTSRTRAS